MDSEQMAFAVAVKPRRRVMRFQGTFAAATLLTLLSLVVGAQESDVLFHAGFDGTVAAETVEGARPPKGISGEPRFEEGVKGKALVAGEAGALLLYLTKGSIDPRRGSIEMWVKPVDWTPEGKAFHVFFMSQSEKGWVQLYKFLAPNSGLLMLVGKGGGRPYVDYWHVSGDSEELLVKGKWVHLVGTWDAGRVALYADGQVVASMQGKGEPTELGETFLVGDYRWSPSRPKCKTLIDEFKIYSRPLAPSEVKRAYRSYGSDEIEDLGPRRPTVVKTSIGERKISFDRLDEPWRGNTIGITDKILPGWVPIKVSGKTLSCWGRDVSFEGTLFPSEIIARDATLLASPIRLEAKADSKPIEWGNTSFDITKRTPARVDFVTSAASDNLRVEIRAYLEYDGMFFFRTKLIPVGARPTLGTLSLVIPFAEARAIFWHYPGGAPDLGGRIAKGLGTVWRRPFREYMWIGDYDRGLTWFAEDCARWNISDATKTLELVRTDGALEWRIHISDARMDLEAPLTIAFGLHPTPVRPLPRGWRLWAMGPEPAVQWTNPHTTTHFGYPEAPDPAYIRRITDDWHRRGVRVIPYMHAVRIGEMSPEWQFYGPDWAMPGVVDSSASDVTKFRGAHLGVCPSVNEVRDWYAWKTQEYLDATGYDGLYYDHAWAYRCSRAGHDHAPGAIPLLAYREHYRRLYTLCKERNSSNLVAAHISGGQCSVFLSWTDITIPGEELVTPMRKARERESIKNTRDLFDVIDFDYYHAWCTGRQFGRVPVYLWPVWCNPRYHNAASLLTDSIGAWRHDMALRQLYQDLGMDADDVEFLPFWDNADLARAHADRSPKELDNIHYPDPLVSAYRRAGKFVMFAVCNMTKADRTVTVTFDAEKLGFDPTRCALTDAYSRHPLHAASETFAVELDGRSHRLILLKKVDEGDKREPVVSLMPTPDYVPPHGTGSAKMVTGTGRLRGDGKELLFVGDAVRDEKATLPQESRLAQTFTLARPTKIQSIKIENREPKVERRGHPCDLRIYTPNADGTPSNELAHPKAWAWVPSRPGSPGFYACFFRESFVLPAGRYVLVLTKPAALPEERHHFAFGLHDKKRLLAETALVWENNAPGWLEVDGVLSFAVFGYER